MANVFETRFAKEVFEMKPNLPKAGITCEHYITDYSSRKSFYNWFDEFKELHQAGQEFINADKQRIKFLKLPPEVRQAIHTRIFGSGWSLHATKKSLYLASMACFQPDELIVSSVYSQAMYNAESAEKYKSKHINFMNTIRRGSF